MSLIATYRLDYAFLVILQYFGMKFWVVFYHFVFLAMPAGNLTVFNFRSGGCPVVLCGFNARPKILGTVFRVYFLGIVIGDGFIRSVQNS